MDAEVIDACLGLSVEDLETSVPGTRGPMLETLRHLVLSDAFDLFVLTGDRAFDVDEEEVSLAEARAIMERNGSGWAEYNSRSLDPDEMVLEVDKTDGYQAINGGLPLDLGSRASSTTAQTIAARSAQRSRPLGVGPPQIDVFDFGLDAGRIVEKMPM